MSESIQLVRTYFISGPTPKGMFLDPRYHVDDPPCGGYTSVFVMPQEKRSTIFDPVNFWSDTVPNGCAELRYAVQVDLTDAKRAQMVRLVTEQWGTWSRMGSVVDYDMAALVLKRLDPDAVVPATVVRGSVDPVTGEVKSRGGKELNEEALRPIRRGSKRGTVAEFFISDEPKSIREAMAQFGMTRSGVLSHLFCINRDNGLPYRLANDTAVIDVPDGWDPFAVVEAPRRNSEGPDEQLDVEVEPKAPRVFQGPKGKPSDPSRLVKIRADSKRGRLARHFAAWASIDAYCQSAELSRSAVLSHLYTIWKENGIGHEVTDDGKDARLIVPGDFDPWDLGPKPKRASKNTPAVTEDEAWLA